MRILVTGAAGFIASHVIERLFEERAHVITGVDNYATGRTDTVAKLSAAAPQHTFDFHRVDVADASDLQRVFKGARPEIVVHAAASYKNPSDWSEDARSNVVGTANVAKQSLNHGVQRIIYFQTSLCYGLHPRECPITIAHPVRPEGSTYAITKTAAEDIIRLSGVPYISFRLANCYGPRNLSGPVPTFYKRLVENQPCFVVNTRRDFMFVDHLVDLVIRATHGEGETGAYHVSSGGDYSIKELYQAVRKALGLPEEEVAERERSEDDVATIKLDPVETKKMFRGWEPTTTLEEGVSKAVAWYRGHEFGETFTHLKLKK